MPTRLLIALAAILALAAAARADAPPAPDALTEGAAASWGAAAQDGVASVSNDASKVKVGNSSLRFDTSGPFDTWLWAPKAKNGSWNLLAGGAGGPSFWVTAQNSNGGGFQNGSPWVRLCSAGGHVEFKPDHDILNEAMGGWVKVAIPVNGSSTWSRTSTGSPDLTQVTHIEVHADTWGAGFVLWLDGLAFDTPLAPPKGLAAIALNAKVALTWTPFSDPGGAFDHYAVYRSTAPFGDVAGMTPIKTLTGIGTAAYTDPTAQNGVGYHYAVTAVLAGGVETTKVASVGPRTPRDESDLQVVSIARTPRYPRFAPIYKGYTITEPSGFGPYFFTAAVGLGNGQTGETQRWPDPGDPVTYTAAVRNRGTNHWTGTVTGAWAVDGQPAMPQPKGVNLAPGETATYTFIKAWDGQSHEIAFSIDAADARPTNNTLAIDTKSVPFLSYIDRTYIENFREEAPGYPGAFSDDFIDWLNNHMARFSAMFNEAGTAKRVHFDILEVLADDAPDPAIDTMPFAIFPFRYRATDGSLRLSGYYNPADDIDYGLLHEMGHQLGLIDLYRLDLPPEKNLVSGTGYSATPCLMLGCSPFLSQSSALAMTHWLDQAHGYFGQYLYGMPDTVLMRFLGSDGQPLEGATVSVYQKLERPGLGEIITTQARATGVTGPDGLFALPNVDIDPGLVPPTYAGDVLKPNPFGYVAVVGTNGLLLFKVEKNGYTDYAWLEITEVNNAYYTGQTGSATFERKLALGGAIQLDPPADMAELNAADWSSWAQDGDIALFDDASKKQVGRGSIRLETTGGFDTYARYPGGLLAKWDLSGVETIRLRCFAQNNNTFQSGSPWVRLGNADGYFEWRSPSDALNQAIGKWAEFSIPVAGSGAWPRTTFGSPSMDEIHYLEIHADTWDHGFTLWLDGVGFDPQPCRADFDQDGALSIDDFIAFQTGFALEDPRADYDGDGAFAIDDFIAFQTAFAVGCP